VLFYTFVFSKDYTSLFKLLSYGLAVNVYLTLDTYNGLLLWIGKKIN